MAGYPPDPSYGLNYGEQNNNYMPSYDQQQMDLANRRIVSNPNYAPPPNGPGSFGAYNMANAQYNANMAPNFGGQTYTPYTPAPNVPSFQMPPPAWNTPPAMPSNPMAWPQQAFNFAQPPAAQYNLPRLDTNPQQQQMPQHSVDMGVQPAEEGELSEGEFQDNSESRMATDTNNNMSGSFYRPDSTQYRSNASPRDNTYRDNLRNATPKNGRQSGQSLSRRHQDFSPRNHQSNNYSPYGSPRQHADTRGPQPSREGGYAPESHSPDAARDFQRPLTSTVQAPDAIPKKPSAVENGEIMELDQPNNNLAETLDDVPDDDRYSPELERSSTPDKRTLAQHAILNLMAAKVQFQDYIHEGIDENLMHGLFESLGMPQTRSKTTVESGVIARTASTNDLSNGHASQKVNPLNTQSKQPQSSTSDKPSKLKGSSDKSIGLKKNTNGETTGNGQQSRNGQHGLGSTESPSTPMAMSTSIATPTATGPVPNGEERKDRIARLLAEKKKATVLPPSKDPSPSNASKQAATATDVAKLKAEKDRQLNIKIENLRKSREARTLKNEAANKTPVTPVFAEARSKEITPVSPLQTASQILPQSSQQPKAASQPPLDSASAPRLSADVIPQPIGQLRSGSQKSDSGSAVPPSAPASKEMAVPQPAPAIPGLFLSSTAAISLPSTNGSRPIPVVSQRKRPVAADFDELTPSSSYKRPFGQSRVEKPLVIDVSDDESSDGDEGSAMDLDRPESSHGSTGPVPEIAPTQAGITARNHQAEPENRRLTAPASVPAQVAQNVQASPKPAPDDLQSKMQQIAELHQKIKEAEAKKKAKASANRSGSQTPLSTEVANAQQNIVNEAIAEKNKASAELERLLEGADAQIASEKQQLADATAAAKEQEKALELKQREQQVADAAAKEQEKALELKQRDIERKRKRRSEIQLGLPAVDAEVEKNQQRLEELRAEMAKAEAAIQKSMEDKKKLESEMAKLGDEAEEQSQTEQTQQVSLPVREAHSSNDRQHAIVPDSQPTRFLATTPQRLKEPAPEDFAPKASSSDTPTNASPSLQNGIGHEKHASLAEVTNQENVEMSDVIPHQQKPNDFSEDNSHQHSREGDSALLISDQQTEKFILPDSTLPPNSTENDKEDVTEDVVQNSNSQQDTNGVVQAQPQTHSPMSVSADQVLEAALQQASAQAEEESRDSHNSDTEMGNTYAPDPSQLEPDSPPSHYTSEGEVHETSGGQIPNHDGMIQLGEDADEESDAYEPPEATPPAFPYDEHSIVNSPPFSPAPPEIVSVSSPKGAPETTSTNLEVTDSSVEPLGSRSIANDEEMPMSAIVTESNHSHSKASTFFTPYESPLKHYSSYRFNKNFSNEIPSGFRSLSYSHKIDPLKEFCRFELAGGACNDTTCEFQHFKDLNLADDMILLQLGDSETFSSQPEVKDSFVTGLRSVLQDLKARKIRDFQTIASEIAAFRAKFNAETLVL